MQLAETADLATLRSRRLGYAQGRGRGATRELVARLHPGATEKILITTGTSEANFLSLVALVEPGREVVVVMPSYMQVLAIARGLKVSVREEWLHHDQGWRLDLDHLRAAVSRRTKVVWLCSPDNQTG